jgi:hypothetical protein
MASANHRLSANFRDTIVKSAALRLADVASRDTASYVEILTGTGVPAGAYGRTANVLIYHRIDAPSIDALIYISVNNGGVWTASNVISATSVGTASTGLTVATAVGGNTASGTAAIGMSGNVALASPGPTDSGNASVSVGGSTANAGSTVSGTSGTETLQIVDVGLFTNAEAAGVATVHAANASNVQAWPGPITDPAQNRQLSVTFDPGWDGGDVSISFLDMGGVPRVEVVADVPGTTVNTGLISKDITAISHELLGAGLTTASVGWTDALGLPGASARVGMLTCDDVGEVATFATQAYGITVTPTTAPNGAHDYRVLYPVSESHDHGVGSYACDAHAHAAGTLSATDAGHAHNVTGTHQHASTGLTATDAGHGHGSTGLTATSTPTEAPHTHSLT